MQVYVGLYVLLLEAAVFPHKILFLKLYMHKVSIKNKIKNYNKVL